MWEASVMINFIRGGRWGQKNHGDMEWVPDQTGPEVHIAAGPFQDVSRWSLLCTPT